jgi:hypothetical protein
MTQFEVMINLAGIKTKEGEDFVKVIKHIGISVARMSLFELYLENGNICFVYQFRVRYNAGTPPAPLTDVVYNFCEIGTGTFWSEFRRVMIEIAGLYEF